MEWMRCNFCWLKVGSKSSIFHLTQCGHLYCDKCIAKAEERCCQCGSTGTISLSLKEPLSPQIVHYFTPTSDLLDKVIQAEQFQQAQQALCLKRSEETENKYQALKEAYWASAENLKKVFQKYNKLKMTVTNMQKNNKMLNTSVTFTPIRKQYCTPPQQIQPGNKQNYSGRYNVQDNQNCMKSNDQVFRVPMVTKVPRSAGSGSGYYTASTSFDSSNCRMNSSISSISKY